ncbi:MAG TPA: hypothetical protein VIV60_02390, partial [Polyangiaceae bacterium]
LSQLIEGTVPTRTPRNMVVSVFLLVIGVSPSALAVSNRVPETTNSVPSVSQTVQRILLLRTAGDGEVMERVRMELRTYGWEIVEIFADEASASRSLAEATAEHHVSAAIRIDAASGKIEICVARTWGNAQEVLSNENGNVDSQVLALRLTEALRAHGLAPAPEVESSMTAATRSNPPNPPAPATATEPTTAGPHVATVGHRLRATERTERTNRNDNATTNSVWLQVAPMLGKSPGGLGLETSGYLGLRAELSPRWSFGMMGIVPLRSREIVTQAEGNAAVRIHAFGGIGEFTPLRSSFGSVSTGLGATALVMTLTGRARAGYVGRNETLLTQAVQGYLRFASAPHASLHVFGIVSAGIAIPELSVRFADREVASWGNPFVAVGLGCELRTLRW